MTFLGLEKPVEYGSRQIFDPTMANMVLQAQRNYVNAVKDDYLRGLAELQDFNKEYADLDSPILADNTSYYNLTKGGIKNMFDEAAKQGVDLLRTPEGRMMVANYIATRPYDKLANLRKSRDAANEYLKNKGKLEAAGLYNPDLEERYLGYNLSGWDTLNNGMWTRTSPAESKTLKELTESWYNNRTPEILNQADVESFGMKFNPGYNYTGFTNRHLLDIAAGETPGWTGSIYSNYFRDLAQQKVASRGLPYTQEDVEKQLQQDIAIANREYKSLTRTADPFALQAQKAADDRALEAIKQNNRIALERTKNANGGGVDEKDLDGFSLAQRWFDKAEAKAWSVNGITKNWWDMKDQYGEFGQNVDKVFYDFGQKIKNTSNTGTFNQDLYNKDLRKAYNDANRSGKYTQEQMRDGDYPKPNKDDAKYYSGNSSYSRIRRYESAFSFDMDPTSVARAIGGPGGTVSGNDRVVQATAADISRLFAVNDYISNTAGFTAQHVDTDTKKIRKEIEDNGANNVTITPLGTGYGSLRKIGGNFEAAPKVRVTITDKDTGEIRSYDAYYDLGLRSAKTQGGAYLGNYKEPIVSGGSKDLGNMMAPAPKFGIGDMEYQGPTYIGAVRQEGLTLPEIGDIKFGTREFNMFPDYNQWSSYGNWDTRESHALSAGASKKLGTY